MRRRIKVKAFDIILPLAVLVLGGILLGWFLNYDEVVMYDGIRHFRLVRNILGIGCGACFAATVIYYIARIAGIKRILERQALADHEMEAAQYSARRQRAKLSVDGQMDATAVRALLEDQTKGKWAFLYESIYGCVEQMEQMDSYQARLDKLLDDNGAEALRDTGEILDQVEQYLCRNVRSALNFMAVADDDAKDKVKEKLDSCKSENKKLLEQTRDFVYAMAEFLNKQGEQTDTRLLESYRTTLLSTIKEDIL